MSGSEGPAQTISLVLFIEWIGLTHSFARVKPVMRWAAVGGVAVLRWRSLHACARQNPYNGVLESPFRALSLLIVKLSDINMLYVVESIILENLVN